MKKLFFFWILAYLLFLSVQAQAPYASLREKVVFMQLSTYQKGDTWDLFFSPFSALPDSQNTISKKKIAIFVEKAIQKKETQNNDIRFLQWLHRQIHEEFLQIYRSPVAFNQIFETKEYDCVTGTLLTAYILEKIAYNFAIIETTDHVYLQVLLPKKTILIETTDPIRGVVTDSVSIEHRLAKHAFKRKISLFQLTGVQYYNQAVRYYQNYRFAEAENSLTKAEMIYASERTQILKPLISKYLQKEMTLVQARKE